MLAAHALDHLLTCYILHIQSKVLLAGGASLPPKIRAVMGMAFDGRDIVNTAIPGNEVFALGAARQAYVASACACD